MTLDDAIKHAEEVAEEHTKYNRYGGFESCDECAEEHRQLAKWLKELKQLKEQTRWIPCSERLPKEGGDYLVSTSFDIGADDLVREVYKDFFCILSQKWLNHDNDVIAWQPLPPSYQGE